MDEFTESKESRRKEIERIVQNPLHYLRENRRRGRSCLECLIFLQRVRREIQTDASCVILNPHPVYASFHRLPNDTVEHYVALFNLLKDAGFNKLDVNDAIIDFLPDEQKDESHGDT